MSTIVTAINPAEAGLHDEAIADLSAFEAVGCLACGSRASTPFLVGEDDLTGRPGRFTFVKCSHCELVYQSPRLTLEGIRPYYEDQYIAHQPHARWGLLATGALCLAGTVGPVVGDMRLQLVGVLGYAVLLPVVSFLLARLFARGRAVDQRSA